MMDGATKRRTEGLDCARISTPQTSKMVVDEGAGGVSSLPRMTVRRRGRLLSVRHVTAPIEGGHADTFRDAGYYAEITEVTIKHG